MLRNVLVNTIGSWLSFIHTVMKGEYQKQTILGSCSHQHTKHRPDKGLLALTSVGTELYSDLYCTRQKGKVLSGKVWAIEA